MIDTVVVVLRLVQYISGSILLGSALFLVYAVPRPHQAQHWAAPLFASAATLLCLSAVLGLAVQTAALAGSLELGLTRDSLQAMISSTGLGKAALVRAVVAAAAVPLLLLMRPGPILWSLASLLGLVGVASFAWMGHGAATEGAGAQVHLVSDVAHALSAAIWIGALVGFVMLIRYQAERSTLETALSRFSVVGVPVVAVLVATGLANSWFLVGLDNLGALFTSPYGRLLLVKLAAFVGMLGLAGLNRWRNTRALARDGEPLFLLRFSVNFEALLGLFVLALVAWFGMLEPPAS